MPVSVSPALRRSLLHLQTRCTADCCKSRAFDLDAPRIESWFRSEPPGRLAETQDAIAVASSEIPLHKELHLEARGLESEWDPVELSSFLAELSAALQTETARGEVK